MNSLRFRAGLLAFCILITASSCDFSDVVRFIKNINIEKEGIRLSYGYVTSGMYQKPIIIRFNDMLKETSRGRVDVDAVNSFTVGGYTKIPGTSIPGVTNFLDPTSLYKDSWFGVYFIFDDNDGKGKRFILKNPSGKPDDSANFNDESLLLLPHLDQKIIVFSSHEGQDQYTLDTLDREFYFKKRPGTPMVSENIVDDRGRSWYKITGEFDSIAALTDRSLTSMGLISSIRAYTGQPNEQVYAMLKPWHPIVLKGSIYARYFPCAQKKFWAVVYYNASAFTTKQGHQVDNWANAELQREFNAMFKGLIVDCR